MNGIKQIIDLRLRGFSPSQVWVYVFSGEPMYFPATHPAQSLENGFLAEIHVTPRDTVSGGLKPRKSGGQTALLM